MNTKNDGFSVPLLGVLVGVNLYSSQSLSAQIEGVELLYTTNGYFSVGEMQAGCDVHYFIDVLRKVPLGGVILSFDGGVGLTDPGREEDGFDGLEPREEGPGREGSHSFSGNSLFAPWAVSFLSEDSWDEGVNIQMASGFHSTLELGRFDSLFGLEDNFVVLYSDVLGGNSLTELNDVDGFGLGPIDETPPHFVRNSGLIATNGLFFDSRGSLVATTIPEPSAALLAVLGSFALFGRRRS